MADYIYLLQTRFTPAQQAALEKVRDAAKAHNMTVFLVGGAVRDLHSGASVRDLDVAVQGDAQALRKELVNAGGTLVGESSLMKALYFSFPGGVRLEVGSTLTVTFPKPGKAAVEPASILDDLRTRDFTANAMAISLNEGSYGLLMDPLNGIADIENMELRLVSNYGFIEDPVRMIRAARLSARLGWRLEEKTQQRYETGKAENYINALNAAQRGYEAEEVFHEEDPLSVLQRLESEGWAKFLYPALNSAKVNEGEVNRLRDLIGQLDAARIHPDPSAAYFTLLTAKMPGKDVEALTKSFVRPGFMKQVEALETEAKAFGVQFMGKAAATPSDAWKMLMMAPPEQVLWLAYSSKSAPVQAKFKAFFTEWPQARHRIPYQLMQEMRITPDLPGYDKLVEDLFFALMDGKLETPEATRAFLEPFSPPAPPPPVNLRRRPVKREAKAPKSRSKKAAAESIAAENEEVLPTGTEESATTPAIAPQVAAAVAPDASRDGASGKVAKTAGAPKTVQGKTGSKKSSPAPAKAVTAKSAPPAAKKATSTKTAPQPVAKSATKQPAKTVNKAAAKKSAVKPKARPKPQPKPMSKGKSLPKPKAANKKTPAKKLVKVKGKSKR